MGSVNRVFVVCHTHKDIGAVHGGVKEAGHHAQHHGVNDEAQKEDQAGQQEAIGSEGLAPYQRTAALWLFDCRFCSQENHQSFRYERFFTNKAPPSPGGRGTVQFLSVQAKSAYASAAAAAFALSTKVLTAVLDVLAGANALQHVPPLGTSVAQPGVIW